MTAHITHCDNTRRLRLVSTAEANATGKAEAAALLAEVFPADEDRTPADALQSVLIEYIVLAQDNRFEELDERLKGFCDVIGPMLYRHQATAVPAVGSCNNERAVEIAAALNEIETEGGKL